MVYAIQIHSREFSTRKNLKVCASVFEIICPGSGQHQNNLPHMKTMVYWLFDQILIELVNRKIFKFHT